MRFLCRSLLPPSFSGAFLRGLHTATVQTRGLNRSHNQASIEIFEHHSLRFEQVAKLANCAWNLFDRGAAKTQDETMA